MAARSFTITLHKQEGTHTCVDLTGAMTDDMKQQVAAFASKRRKTSTAITDGVQFVVTHQAALELMAMLTAQTPDARIPIAPAPAGTPRLTGLIGSHVPVNPPKQGTALFALRAFETAMRALGPTDAPVVHVQRNTPERLRNGHELVDEVTTVKYKLSPTNSTDSAVIILQQLSQTVPVMMPVAVAFDPTQERGWQIDVNYPAELDLGISGVAGYVHTIDPNTPAQLAIHEANIVEGSTDEAALKPLEDAIFSRTNAAFIYCQRDVPTDDFTHASAVFKFGRKLYVADPHKSCTDRESRHGWIDNVALERGLELINLGTFGMQGEESTCMVHAVLLLLLMVQYLPHGVQHYRDHPLAERYWYCLLVYMLFKREQIEDEIVGDASVTEQ